MASFQVTDGTEFVMNYEVIPNVVPSTTLFIHGNLASNRWWYPTEEALKKSGKGKAWNGSMILADFRGAGKSSAPKSESEVNMHTFANDYISLVRSLGLGKIHLVGHSTGGLIAALMMAKAPDLFEHALLLDPVGATGVKFDNSMIQAFEAMKNDKNLTATVIGSTIHNNDVNSDFFRTIVVEDAFSAVGTVGHWVLKALDGFDARAEISKVQNKVVVCHGQFDQLLPMADSKALADLMPNSTFKIVEGHGHCMNAESPSDFASLLLNSLYKV